MEDAVADLAPLILRTVHRIQMEWTYCTVCSAIDTAPVGYVVKHPTRQCRFLLCGIHGSRNGWVIDAQGNCMPVCCYALNSFALRMPQAKKDRFPRFALVDEEGGVNGIACCFAVDFKRDLACPTRRVGYFDLFSVFEPYARRRLSYEQRAGIDFSKKHIAIQLEPRAIGAGLPKILSPAPTMLHWLVDAVTEITSHHAVEGSYCSFRIVALEISRTLLRANCRYAAIFLYFRKLRNF